MTNRESGMELKDILARNLTRVLEAHDMSANDLANRSGMAQKTLHSMVNGTHQCRIDNLDNVAKALLVSPTTLVTPELPTNLVMSRKLPRLMKKYANLTSEQRDKAEEYIDSLI